MTYHLEAERHGLLRFVGRKRGPDFAAEKFSAQTGGGGGCSVATATGGCGSCN